jgi:hypothetical protein
MIAMSKRFEIRILEDALDRANLDEFEEAMRTDVYWYNFTDKSHPEYDPIYTLTRIENTGFSCTVWESIFWFDICEVITAFRNVERTVLVDVKQINELWVLTFDMHPHA